MRYAVIHCRNPKCLLKVWVLANMLGTRGHCPRCGDPLQAPASVPPDELTEGPPIMQIQQDDEDSHALAASA